MKTCETDTEIHDKYNICSFIFPKFQKPLVNHVMEIEFNRYFYKLPTGFYNIPLWNLLASLNVNYYDLGNKIILPFFNTWDLPRRLKYTIKKPVNLQIPFATKICGIPHFIDLELLKTQIQNKLDLLDLLYFYMPEIGTMWINSKISKRELRLNLAGQEFICQISDM